MTKHAAQNANTVTGVPRLRLGVALWSMGMLGVVAVTTTVLPQMLRGTELSVPLWLVLSASLLQSAMLVALAVWLGTALAPAVGLEAPTVTAAVSGHPLFACLRKQLGPGVIAGVGSGIGLFALGSLAPDALIALQDRFTLPLSARILYGGITEELLMRWGLMTTVLWIAWRFLQQRQGAPKAVYVWLAIGVSALVFAVAHLPAAASMVGELTLPVSAFVVGGNLVFGVVFGYMYWRHGLEAAMLAHAMAHAVAFVLGLL